MAQIVLSSGTAIRSENVVRAEYYPKDALNEYGCHFGGPEMRECPFLFIEMKEGAQRISGAESEEDAKALEAAGVRVIRHAAEHEDPPL